MGVTGAGPGTICDNCDDNDILVCNVCVHTSAVLGRIVNLDRIPNTEYIRVLKMNRIRIPNSTIRS